MHSRCPDSKINREKLIDLYMAINELMMEMGIEGEVSSTSEKAEDVMSALYELDGGVYDVEVFQEEYRKFMQRQVVQ